MTLDYLLMLEALMPVDDENDTPAHESHEAIDWFARLQADDVTPEDRRRFEQWLRQRPGHARAFEQVKALWAALDEPSRAAYQQLGSAVQQVPHARLPAAIPGPPHPSARTLSLRRWRIGSAAAVVAVSVACLVLWLPDMVRIWNSAYHTDWGERRAVVLEDGSTVLLNTHSALAVKFSPQRRETTLVEGEAFFEVAANPDRPFIVLTDQGRTQVVGTRFSVARQRDHATVIVEAGRVEVSALHGHGSLPLSAGWQVQYTADGLTAPERADLLRSLAWRNGRLVFHLTPLTAVIKELNRYYTGRIMLVNPQLGRRLVNGVVDISNPQAALQAIQETFALRTTSVTSRLVFVHQ